MPDPATPDQSATATRPRQSPNGIAPPLPGETARTRQSPPARLRKALTQLRGMMRRTAHRP
jgi:hypothetical protein